jgi:hypothetical protein
MAPSGALVRHPELGDRVQAAGGADHLGGDVSGPAEAIGPGRVGNQYQPRRGND